MKKIVASFCRWESISFCINKTILRAFFKLNENFFIYEGFFENLVSRRYVFALFDPVPPKCAIPDLRHVKKYAKEVSKQDSKPVSDHVEKSSILVFQTGI